MVYDATGREVARVADRTYGAGHHAAEWSAKGLPAGVYLYRLYAGASSASGRLVLVR